MILTNTRLRTWRTCPRKEYLSFNLALEPYPPPEYLAFGSAFHAALAGVAFEADPFVRVAVDKTVAQYREPVEIIAREEPFEVVGFFGVDSLGGTIDAIGRLQDGRLAIIERKTTSRPSDALFANLDLDTQVLTYWLGARAVGYPVEAVLYAVQQRPQQRPFKATPEENRNYTKDGRLYAKQRDRDETPEEYHDRLVVEPPQFREVAVLHDSVERHRHDMLAQYQIWAQRVRWRNPQACEDCWFRSVCLRTDLADTVPDGFRRTPRAGIAAHP